MYCVCCGGIYTTDKDIGGYCIFEKGEGAGGFEREKGEGGGYVEMSTGNA